MKLATLDNGTPDGSLVVVSRDLRRCVQVPDIAPTLQRALETWAVTQPRLDAVFRDLESGSVPGSPFDAAKALSPLPRAYQWLDGSVYRSHLLLMSKAFNIDPEPHLNSPMPLMYQGGSDTFNPPEGDIVLPRVEDGIDFEAEVGVITDRVEMGTNAQAALDRIRLIVLINDVSLRTLLPRELGTGFGPVHGKPSTTFAPVAVTPDELGEAWRDGKVCLPVHVHWNGAKFGSPNAEEMSRNFGELIAHAAGTRHLSAGTIIGSGTVSNHDAEKVGSGCIAERRAIELVATGNPKTNYMNFGDRVRIEVFDGSGASVFGAIDQKVRQHK